MSYNEYLVFLKHVNINEYIRNYPKEEEDDVIRKSNLFFRSTYAWLYFEFQNNYILSSEITHSF